MDDNFKFRATIKSNEELHYCIDNREKYLPETVEAAVDELKIRGVEFSEEELTVIAEDMQARRDIAEEEKNRSGTFNRIDKNYQVEDPDAPSYYSKRVIVVFSILFSVLFGSVMLAVNVNKAQNTAKAILVVLYGLCFTALVVVIASNFNVNTGVALISGYVGAYTMELLFWNRYIGASALYRPKPIWVPLGIALAIIVPLAILIIKYGTP